MKDLFKQRFSESTVDTIRHELTRTFAAQTTTSFLFNHLDNLYLMNAYINTNRNNRNVGNSLLKYKWCQSNGPTYTSIATKSS